MGSGWSERSVWPRRYRLAITGTRSRVVEKVTQSGVRLVRSKHSAETIYAGHKQAPACCRKGNLEWGRVGQKEVFRQHDIG